METHDWEFVARALDKCVTDIRAVVWDALASADPRARQKALDRILSLIDTPRE